MSVADAFEWYRWAQAVNARGDVRSMAVRVALALATHADNATGECYPSEWTLAKECGYPGPSKPRQRAPRAIQGAVAELRSVGVLELTPGTGRRPSQYKLVPVESWPQIERTSVRPIKAQGRSLVRTSSADGCASAANGIALQARTEVRPELLTETAQEEPPHLTTSSPPPIEEREEDGIRSMIEEEDYELASADEETAVRRAMWPLRGETAFAEALDLDVADVATLTVEDLLEALPMAVGAV